MTLSLHFARLPSREPAKRGGGAVPALASALADEGDVVRKEVIIALRKIGPAARAPPALTAIQDYEVLGLLARDAVKDVENR